MRELLPLEGVEVGIQPTVQALSPADRKPDPAPRSKSLFRCIPCDCHTTLVHSPLLVFACSLSAVYFGVSLAFSLLLLAFGELRGKNPFLAHCSDIFNAEKCAAVDVEKEVAQAESAANGLHLTALILALLINNKWLKCQFATLPKTSLCAEVAVCLLTGVIGFAAFIASTVEASACFSCELITGENSTINFESFEAFVMSLFPAVTSLFRSTVRAVSPLSVMRFESFLGVITSLFLLIAVAWMALGRVPWTASMKLFRGHADLTDERASTIRHLLTSRVYIGLLVGLLVNIAIVIYFGSLLHGWLASMDGWRSWLPGRLESILSRLSHGLVGAMSRLIHGLVGAGMDLSRDSVSEAMEWAMTWVSRESVSEAMAWAMAMAMDVYRGLFSLFGGEDEDEGEGGGGGAAEEGFSQMVNLFLNQSNVVESFSQMVNLFLNQSNVDQAVDSMLLLPFQVEVNSILQLPSSSLLQHGETIDSFLVLPKTAILFVLILLYVQLAVCVLASAFNGWKHLQHWRTVTKVVRAQVTPTPAEGISPAQPDGLDAEHSRLLDVGSKSLISASRLPALMCASLACGSVIIALVLSTIITALYTWSANKFVRNLVAPIIKYIGYFLAFLIASVLSRMVLARCLFHPNQLKGGGEVWPMQRPICFAWYEAVNLVVAIAEGIWIGASRLVITIAHAVASLLRMDRPSYSEGRVVHDVVFRSYAAVLCLERDAEASRRKAGATHFESGVLAVESDVSLKHSALWCLGWLAAVITPFFIIFLMVL